MTISRYLGAKIRIISEIFHNIAHFYTLFNRQCLNTGTNKREKQFFDLKVQSVALQSSKQGTGHYDNGEFAVYDFLISTFQV